MGEPPSSPKLREVREACFAANGLPADGGYGDAWVVIRAGAIPVVAFPNSADRLAFARWAGPSCASVWGPLIPIALLIASFVA